MALPDFLLDPNVVLKDDSKWRYENAPDYTLTNANFEATKSKSWEKIPRSLEYLVQNLVKNWEKEASYKVDSQEWRTISQDSYEFRLNGGPAQSATDMLRLGTYNALIGENGVKGAMKTFNWEVLEVLGAPPKVSIKWRHWGTMTGSYRATLNSGRLITAKANGKLIEVFGITVAGVNDKFEITSLETFWEPDSMFRQMITEGVETMEEGERVEELAAGIGSSCPVAH